MSPLNCLQLVSVALVLSIGVCSAQISSLDAGSQRVVAGSNNQWRIWGRAAGDPLNPLNQATLTSRPTVVPMPAGVTAASAGRNHTLYLTQNGSVLSSGYDRWGERGRGTGATYPVPNTMVPRVEDAPGATAFAPAMVGVEAGFDISFAWSSNGLLSACGDGRFGGFGTGVSVTPTDIPVSVPVPASVVEVANEGNLVIARDSQGGVWHWGIATGAPSSFVPVTQVPSLPGTTAVAAAGQNAYAIATNGSLWTWTLDNPVPALVPGLPPLRSIEASESVVLALSQLGIPWCVSDDYPRAWGYFDALSALGTAGPPAPPRMIASLSNIIDIAATSYAAYALDASGIIWVWGAIDGATGLGLGSESIVAFVPQQVPLSGSVLTPTETQIACGPPGAAGILLTSSAATLGAEIIISSIASAMNNWLFLAEGPAEATPWFPLGPCAAFLSPIGLQNYLNSGIGPFPAQQFGIGSGAALPFWTFQIPNDPTALGLTFTIQAVVLPGPQSPFIPVITNAFSFTIQ